MPATNSKSPTATPAAVATLDGWISITDFCAARKISRRTCLRWIEAGLVPKPVRVGRQVMFRTSTLCALMARQETEVNGDIAQPAE